MRKWVIMTFLSLLAVALVITGCERKVVVEDSNSTELTSCFTCHGDDNLALVQAHGQWEHSVHAEAETLPRAASGSCTGCHGSEGFIARWTGEDYEGDHYSAIGCFTCHAPHTNGDLSLRYDDAYTLEDGTVFDRGAGNLCASCHHSRRDVNEYVTDDVELSEHWGPHHSNQSDMLIGANAYEFDGYEYSNSPHTNVAMNACVDCHMAAAVGYQVGGHTWNMRGEDGSSENTNGCNVAACHDGDVEDIDFLANDDFDMDGEIEGVQSEIHGIMDTLAVFFVNAGWIEEDEGEYHPIEDVVISDADSAGALYNWLYIKEDRSFGVHNTDYSIGLLMSAYNFMTTGDPNGLSVITQPELLASH